MEKESLSWLKAAQETAQYLDKNFDTEEKKNANLTAYDYFVNRYNYQIAGYERHKEKEDFELDQLY